ncbi:hypothetical protein [Morganella phage Mecenats66]|nr:hypothetical protein [Morganella phage Mecenats66]
MHRKNELVLNLNREYFHDIRVGLKTEEYRRANKYWKTRLDNAEKRGVNVVSIRLGYPAADDSDRILLFRYNGFTEKTITHPLFGSEPVKVYAIDLSKPLTDG